MTPFLERSTAWRSSRPARRSARTRSGSRSFDRPACQRLHPEILDVDMVDGTPLLDIKPFVPAFDHRDEVRIGWYAAAWATWNGASGRPLLVASRGWRRVRIGDHPRPARERRPVRAARRGQRARRRDGRAGADDRPAPRGRGLRAVDRDRRPRLPRRLRADEGGHESRRRARWRTASGASRSSSPAGSWACRSRSC